MGAYEALAASYDRLTNDVDYGAIVAFYEEILKKEGLKPRTAVDLACGTGSVSAILAGKGLSVIGVDMSEEMLTAAQQKCADLQNPPRFVRQSLQRLCLPRGVDLAVCALDSLDYITNPGDCKEAIRRVWKALNPGGIFIFDVNTPEKFRAMDGQVFLDEDTTFTASGGANLTKKAISAPTAWICSSAGGKRGFVLLKNTGSMPILRSS